ncbi:response regulator transcription factor [Nocardiopsis sp. N85]|uniref:response regulator transcription factor n=1 Tax=Nocardiopsis sp. N85 TaxID=3029400 RepID=UPI00237F066F|nr:response regulator transcription factor [Nocardiopsis sp. N85]MDE3722520.1 response regulator transcription factor [Nocardiopsis sp. N85]
MIRVLVADDQAMVRGALATVLDLEPDIEVVARVGDGAGALAEARRTLPDVALLDVRMPGGDGIEVCAELVRTLPGCRVLMCTTFGRPGYLTRALRAGAGGFVVKDASPEDLVDAVRRVHRGLRVVDPDLAVASLTHGTSPLTPREREVLAAVLHGGDDVASLAGSLGMSQGTLRNHLSSAIGKTGTRTRAEAARVAEEHGWL